jgi:hypothetical protein
MSGDNPPVAAEEATLSPGLYSHPCLMAQPGRTLVRTAHTAADQAQLAQKRSGTGGRDPMVHRRLVGPVVIQHQMNIEIGGNDAVDLLQEVEKLH